MLCNIWKLWWFFWNYSCKWCNLNPQEWSKFQKNKFLNEHVRNKKQQQHSYFGNTKARQSRLGLDIHCLLYIVLVFVFYACTESSWFEISRILQVFHESLDHPTESGRRTWDPEKRNSLFCVRRENKDEKKNALTLSWFTFNHISCSILATRKWDKIILQIIPKFQRR